MDLLAPTSEDGKDRQDVCHLFVDEAGTPDIFDAKGRNNIGQQGCSRFFFLGMLEVDDSGKLIVRDDIYGHDTRIHTILNSDERKIAETPPPQDKVREAAATTAKSNPEILRRVERGTAPNPLQFFERLFR